MSSKKTVRASFLDPAAIDIALAQIAKIVKPDPIYHPIHVALAGGCAMQLYGSPRFTKDIDLIASDNLPRAAGLRTMGKLSFGGRSLITKDGTEIDVIVRADQYADLYADALIAARKMSGSPVSVVTLPYLVAMKLAAGRGKDEQDLEFILCNTTMRYEDARTIVKQHLGLYAADELDEFRDIARWRYREGKNK